MPDQERRISPRKPCSVPLRFRFIKNGRRNKDSALHLSSFPQGSADAHFGMLEGEAQNLSERGVYFVCTENIHVGQEVEMFFTIPGEFTGRGPENIHCKARIVHAQALQGNRQLTGAGVAVKRFEALARPYTWAH
jgi:hypothetical protein